MQFFSLHSVSFCRLFSSRYLNMQPFAQGNSIFNSGKKTCMALIYCHHIIKLSKSIFFFFPTKPFAYLCTHNWFSVISPAKCHQDNWALQQGWYKALTEVLIDCHILSQLWNTEEERGREGAYALNSWTSKSVPVLNIFKELCLENIILYFFRLVKMQRIKWDRG